MERQIQHKLILGSQSPRRKELLSYLGIPFEVQIKSIDEDQFSGTPPCQQVVKLAEAKNRAHQFKIQNKEEILVLTADTIVELNGEALNKPADRDSARAMLLKLQNQTHLVHTGVCVSVHSIRGIKFQSVIETTEVDFGSIEESVLTHYLNTASYLDKAGSYGIQEGGAVFVKAIRGSYSNVVGLPLERVLELLNFSN